MKVSKLLLTGIILLSFINISYADSTKIFSGRDRVETSLKVANTIDSKVLVLANAYSFADSLSAFNLVSTYNAKLVLIDDKTDLDFSQFNDLAKVYLVGGENVLKGKTIDKLKSMNIDYERISGENRYLTNIETLEKAGYDKIGVADGRNYPDALTASPLLKKKRLGLMLVDGSKSYKTDKKVLYTFGGKNSVAQNGGVRLSGADRYATNDRINNEVGEYKSDILVDGNNFADALSSINLLSKSSDFRINLLNKQKNISKYKDIHIVGGIAEKIYIESNYKSYNTDKTELDENKKNKPDTKKDEKKSKPGDLTLNEKQSDKEKENNKSEISSEIEVINGRLKFPIKIYDYNIGKVFKILNDERYKKDRVLFNIIKEARELDRLEKPYEHLYDRYVEAKIDLIRAVYLENRTEYIENFKDNNILEDLELETVKKELIDFNSDEKKNKRVEIKVRISKIDDEIISIENSFGAKKEKIKKLNEEKLKLSKELSKINWFKYRESEQYYPVNFEFSIEKKSFIKDVTAISMYERDYDPLTMYFGDPKEYANAYYSYQYISINGSYKSKIHRGLKGALEEYPGIYEKFEKYTPEGYEIISGKKDMPKQDDMLNRYSENKEEKIYKLIIDKVK